MATKKTTKKTEEKAVAPKSALILGPRITEKAAILAEQNGYTFNVALGATKNEIAKAIKAQYKVTPVSVRVVNMKPKPKQSRKTGKLGFTSRGKKAYVYLKKGDKIEVL